MLILLRGNSGSGKSTTAKLLREAILERDKSRKVAIVEQDYLRRFILKEKETEGTDNIELIKLVSSYALKQGYDVILEGIFYSKRYSEMLKQLLSESAYNLVYYFDISLEETLRRHQKKPNRHEFGEKEMRGWYNDHDVLGVPDERLLGEDLSQREIVRRILQDLAGT